MQVSKQVPRLVLAAIVAAAVAGPVTAQAQQAYDVNQVTGEYTQAGKAEVGSDLRTESAKSPIVSDLKVRHAPVVSDLRSESAKGPRVSTPPAGLPTWPLDPKPIAPTAPKVAPVAATDADDGSFDWPAGLIVGGIVVLAGGVLLADQLRRRHIPAH